MPDAVLIPEVGLPLLHRGKVRDIYEWDDKHLLIITTDRLSAFDVVFDQGIPGKGGVLRRLTEFWANRLPSARPFHLVDPVEEHLIDLTQPNPALDVSFYNRTEFVQKLDMLQVECIVRGYIVGSAWKDYQQGRPVGDYLLPAGLQCADRLPQPLFTPTTKAPVGEHDEPMSFSSLCDMYGKETAFELADRSLALYAEAAAYARERGLILVDTKFEFGRAPDGTLVLADEVLTPDSSRYWDAEETAGLPRGIVPTSFDKQIVRDYLTTTGWDRKAPAPELPQYIIDRTAARYRELETRLTGRKHD